MTRDFEIDEREARLPAWARERLSRLRHAVVEAERRYSLAVEAPVSEIVVDPYREPFRYLPRHETVRFHLGGPGKWPYVDVRLNHGTSEVEVLACSSLTVRPGASNVVRIGVDR